MLSNVAMMALLKDQNERLSVEIEREGEIAMSMMAGVQQTGRFEEVDVDFLMGFDRSMQRLVVYAKLYALMDGSPTLREAAGGVELAAEKYRNTLVGIVKDLVAYREGESPLEEG